MNIDEIKKKVANRILTETALAALEDRRNTVNYQSVDAKGKAVTDAEKTTKIIATLVSYDSARYTKLGRQLKRMEAVAALLERAKQTAKADTRELLADLFDATDTALTREVETVNFLFKMSKDPKPTEKFQWAKIMDEFSNSLLPEQLTVLEGLKKKFSSVTQAAPALATVVDKDKVPPAVNDDNAVKRKAKKAVNAVQGEGYVAEGLMDGIKKILASMKSLVDDWARRFDAKMEKMQAMWSAVAEDVVDEAQPFNLGIGAPKSIVSQVSPDEVTIVCALWFQEPGWMRDSGKSSDKIWAVVKVRNRVFKLWGKRNGNQVTGSRSWSGMETSIGPAMNDRRKKTAKGYVEVVSQDRITDFHYSIPGIMDFIKNTTAMVLAKDEFAAAMATPIDAVAGLGGANESVELGESTVHVDVRDQSVARIIASSFPDYRGTKCQIQTGNTVSVYDGWDGGSRTDSVFVNLDTLQAIPVPTPVGAVYSPVAIPSNVAAVQHVIFSGKDLGIRITVRPENAAPLLPNSSEELTIGEQIVLVATRSLKSSYGGRSRAQMAFMETDIPAKAWEEAKTSLIGKGYLNASGALTIKGRNAAGDTNLHSLRWQ